MIRRSTKRKMCRRAVSYCLATSMVLTMASANLCFAESEKVQAAVTQESDIFFEPDADRMIADASPAKEASEKDMEKIKTITMMEGSISSNGLQTVTFVDDDGKKVDLEEEAEEITGVTSEEVAEATGEWEDVGASYSNKSGIGGARNQGSYGVCWAFASTAVMEANILADKKCTAVLNSAGDLDLSERHMAWFAHNTYSTLSTDPTKKTDGEKKNTTKKAYVGGNYYQALAYLSRGSGMELEENLPYSTDSLGTVPEADRYDSVVTVHDSYEVKYDKQNIDTTITAVKNLVNTYGAAGISYLSSDAGYSKGTDTMAFYQTSTGTNHAVCIVGYDDDFAISNFTGAAGKPPKPGAWLIRNSWGSNWGDDGYFWMSYYDASLSSCFAYNAVDSADYGDIYQYDPTGSSQYAKINGAANVFKARKDDTLKSVGIYVPSAVAKGAIQIYTKDTKMTNPADGTLAHTEMIPAITYAGYHIIDLSDQIPLAKGEYFSVVVTLGESGSSALYAHEGVGKGHKIGAGETYFLMGSQWTDVKKVAGNACIKALMTSENDDLTLLDELIDQASSITKDSIADYAGDTVYNWIQKELAAAKAAQKTKAADDVTRAVKRLTQAMSHTGSTNLYADSGKTKGSGPGGASMNVGGGKFKKDGVTYAYGAKTYYFNVNKLTSWKVSKGKYVAAINGKYVAVITSTNQKPTLDESGNPVNPDEAAQTVVKAKISGTKVKITPLKEGTAYVWILYYPKLGRAKPSEKENYAVTKVTVGAQAPSVVKLYDTAQKAADCTDTTITQYKGTVIPQGGSTSVYVTGTVGKRTKKVDTLAPTKLDGMNFEPIIPAKYRSYIIAERDVNQINKFTIRIANNILDTFKIKANKKLAVSIPFYCNKNGKKLSFKVTIGNPVKSISLAAAEDESNLTLQENDGITEVAVKQPEDGKAVTAKIVETKQLYHEDRTCTDSNAVLRMAKADDIIYNANNVVVVSTKLDAAQKKITMALQKDKSSYKISVAKGTPVGTSVYFVIRYNAYAHVSGAGYKIVKVTVV